MSWLTDLFKPQPKHYRPMNTELAPTDPTSFEPELITVPEPGVTVIEAAHPRLSSGNALDAETPDRHLLAKSQPRLQGLALRVAAVRSRLLDLTAADEA